METLQEDTEHNGDRNAISSQTRDRNQYLNLLGSIEEDAIHSGAVPESISRWTKLYEERCAKPSKLSEDEHYQFSQGVASSWCTVGLRRLREVNESPGGSLCGSAQSRGRSKVRQEHGVPCSRAARHPVSSLCSEMQDWRGRRRPVGNGLREGQ